MKKLLSLLAIVGIISVSNCSRIPENNDPVIGIWSQTEILESRTAANKKEKNEWIFNDAYLGRYHRYEGNTIVFENDFRWTIEDNTYTLEYPGTGLPNSNVVMTTSNDGKTVLTDENGNIMAVRE